jgi:ParB-like chromosome segregation protein Spo0J
MKVSALKENPDNPRKIDPIKLEKLINSIHEFPAMMELRPIVVDAENTVLGGNMRLTAIRRLGMKEIPDTWVKRATDLTDEEKQRFIIADNVGFGDWDWQALQEGWDAGDLGEWGLDVPEFKQQEEAQEADPFDDVGIGGKSQYGVIVICENAGNQESVYSSLTAMGYECKIVVT